MPDTRFVLLRKNKVCPAFDAESITNVETLYRAQCDIAKCRIRVMDDRLTTVLRVDRDQPSGPGRAFACANQPAPCQLATHEHVVGHQNLFWRCLADLPRQQSGLATRPPRLLAHIKMSPVFRPPQFARARAIWFGAFYLLAVGKRHYWLCRADQSLGMYRFTPCSHTVRTLDEA